MIHFTGITLINDTTDATESKDTAVIQQSYGENTNSCID